MLNENIINITWQYWIRVERKKKKVLHTDLTCTNVNTETLFYLLLDYSENSNICMSCVVHDFGWKVTPLSNLETVTTFVSIHFFTSEINNHTSSPFYTSIINFSKAICHPDLEYCITLIAVSKSGRPAA